MESIIEQTAVEREILSSQEDYLAAKSAADDDRQCGDECFKNGEADAMAQEEEGTDSFELRGEKYKSRTIKTLR